MHKRIQHRLVLALPNNELGLVRPDLVLPRPGEQFAVMAQRISPVPLAISANATDGSQKARPSAHRFWLLKAPETEQLLIHLVHKQDYDEMPDIMRKYPSGSNERTMMEKAMLASRHVLQSLAPVTTY